MRVSSGPTQNNNFGRCIGNSFTITILLLNCCCNAFFKAGVCIMISVVPATQIILFYLTIFWPVMAKTKPMLFAFMLLRCNCCCIDYYNFSFLYMLT